MNFFTYYIYIASEIIIKETNFFTKWKLAKKCFKNILNSGFYAISGSTKLISKILV